MKKTYTITNGPTIAYRGRYLRAGTQARMADDELSAFSKEIRVRFEIVEAKPEEGEAEAGSAAGEVDGDRKPPPAASENKPVHIAYAIDVLKLPKSEVVGTKDEIIALIKKTIDAA